MALAIPLVAGTPRRLESDCPSCGWADLWQVALHTLQRSGVGTAAVFAHCARCGARSPARRKSP